MSKDGTPPLPYLDAIPQIDIEPATLQFSSFPRAASPHISGQEWIVRDRGESLYTQHHAHTQGLYPATTDEYSRPRSSQGLRQCLHQSKARIVNNRGEVQEDWYFPKGALERIIDMETVAAVLRSEAQEQGRPFSNELEIQHYAGTICQTPGSHAPGGDHDSTSVSRSYRKIFAVLVLADRTLKITDFVKHRLSDEDLPLVQDFKNRNVEFELRRASEPNQPLHKDCFDPEVGYYWTYSVMFEKNQWKTLVPFFAKAPERQVWLYSLDPKDVLPWTKIEQKTRAGGYSEVSQVHIHASHHNFDNSKFANGSFALKKLLADHITLGPAPEANNGVPNPKDTLLPLIGQDFKAEVDSLRRFSGVGHDHLISLLMAIQRGKDYYLLFHWAEFDLRQYWYNTAPGNALDMQNMLWMMEQFVGIAGGLSYIHHYRASITNANQSGLVPNDSIFGRHGDIKPENLLVFKRSDHPDSRCTIQVSDFGLVRFHSEFSRSGIPPSRLDGCSPTYRPPEVEFKDGKVSRAYDIWSLACVLLEFITWYLGGRELLAYYVGARKRPDLYSHASDQFFEILVRKGNRTDLHFARVKYEVVQWISDLHAHEHCSDPIHKLLRFIQTEMLVVLPNESALDGCGWGRASCGDVVQEFQRIYNEVKHLSQLVATPRPKNRVEATELQAVQVTLSPEAERKATRRRDELRHL